MDIVEFESYGKQYPRTNQRTLQPASVNSRNLNNSIIQNTDLTSGSFSIGNGVTITITSLIVSDTNALNHLAACPYEIAFFETSSASANLIPFGSAIATGRYTITSMAMPGLSPVGTDGNNLVFKTAIANNSGSTQTILYYVQCRFISGGGVAG